MITVGHYYSIIHKYILEFPLQINLEVEKDLINKGLQEPNENLKGIIQDQIKRLLRQAQTRLRDVTSQDLKKPQDDRLALHFQSLINQDVRKAKCKRRSRSEARVRAVEK